MKLIKELKELKRKKYFLKILNEIANNSTCYKYKVWAIITINWKIISTWYNWTNRWIIECEEYYNFLNYFVKNLKKEEKIEKYLMWKTFWDNNLIFWYFKSKFNDYFSYIWRDKYLDNQVMLNYLFEKAKKYDLTELKKIIIDNDLELKKNWISKNNIFHSDLSIFWEIHAEQNAITFAAREWISLEWAILWCNYLPCIHCAKLIVASWIKKVYFENYYYNKNLNNETTVEFFKANWIELEQLNNDIINKNIEEIKKKLKKVM